MKDVSELKSVWVFSGVKASFPAAVFSDLETAQAWIAKGQLSGTLSEYPLDESVYDWCIRLGHFKPRRPEQASPEFVQRFSSASQEHFHYTAGQLD
jgi:hypothetical protein